MPVAAASAAGPCVTGQALASTLTRHLAKVQKSDGIGGKMLLERGFTGRPAACLVLADEQPCPATLIDAESRLRRQVVAAPADAVVFQRAAHAVVGHRAVLQADAAAGAETSGEERAQRGGAAVGVVRAEGAAEVPIGGECA